jgi:hypothetical protein
MTRRRAMYKATSERVDLARAALNRSDMEFSFRMYAGSPTEAMTTP